MAAEAAASVGRTNDARELAARALAAEPDRIDELFAGQPRSPVWPAPRVPAPPAGPPPAVPPPHVRGIPMIPPLPRQPAAGAVAPVALGRGIPDRHPGRSSRRRRSRGNRGARRVGCRGAHRYRGACRGQRSSHHGASPGARVPTPGAKAPRLPPRISSTCRPRSPAARSPASRCASNSSCGSSRSWRRQCSASPTTHSGSVRPPHECASLHLVRADAYRLMGRETQGREAFQEASRALRGAQQLQENP